MNRRHFLSSLSLLIAITGTATAGPFLIGVIGGQHVPSGKVGFYPSFTETPFSNSCFNSRRPVSIKIGLLATTRANLPSIAPLTKASGEFLRVQESGFGLSL